MLDLSFISIMELGLAGLTAIAVLLVIMIIQLGRIIALLPAEPPSGAYRPGPSGRELRGDENGPGEAHIPSSLLPWERMADDEE